MLSVIILVKNEQDRIKTCLESVRWADEIIVVDNGSTDKTLEIAEKYTDTILRFADQDFASLRNKGFEKTKGDWILYVDCDERVLETLKNEIKKLVISQEYSAYAIPRKNIIFGTEVNYGPYKYDWVIRLFRKSNFEKWTGKVHESPHFKGQLGYTKNSLLHLTHRDIDQIILKSLEWSKIDAKLRFQSNHPPMTGWRFLRIFITEVWYQGIVRRGFFNGTIGIMDSVLQALSLFITYVRLWQIQQSKFFDETYKNIDKNLEESKFTSFK